MSAQRWRDPVRVPDVACARAARARQARLTKPPGSLGRLEEVVCRLAALQASERPRVDAVRIVVFAADHGVAAQGVSAFPQAVTAEMVRNFARGGAAINVLARSLGASLEVVNLGTVHETGRLPGVIDRPIGSGTADLAREPAMAEAQLLEALAAGGEAAERAGRAEVDLLIGGDMGIGNTTAASAVASALLSVPPRYLAGPGTGLDAAGVRRKAAVIEHALALHGSALAEPLEVLRRLGGFEMAALVGLYLRGAQLGIPLLVDGFIATTAALVAVRVNASAREWFIYAHRSAEPGHRMVLETLQAEPLLSLGMRLGEASGAAVAVPLLRLACALHEEMATFEEAGVSAGPEPQP